MTQTTRIPTAAVAVLFIAGGAQALVAQQERPTGQQDTLQQARIDAPGGYAPAGQVTGLPPSVPGLGILFVKEENAPAGPYLAYSPDGELLSSVVFLPASGLESIQGGQEPAAGEQRQREREYAQQPIDPGQLGGIELEESNIDHVEVRFDQGFAAARAGLNEPHYQIILWHVSPDRARELGQELGEAGAERQGDEEVGGEEEELEGLTTRDMLTGRTTEDIEPPEGFSEVANVVQLPEFIQGVGFLYVKPENAPMGPYVAYDYDAALVSTVLMIPAEEMSPQTLEELAIEKREIEFIEIEFEQGHEGAASPLDQPHYRVILWHVPAADVRLEVGG